MTRPTLGIALITFNAAARLAQCLEAVSFADEIVVIDGGSTDASQDEIDDAWRGEIGNRLDDVLQGRAELGSFEATRAKFAAEYPASTR